MSPPPEPSTWTWRSLVPFVRPDLRWFLVSLGAMPILAGLGVLQPVVLREVVDEHVTVGRAEGLQFLAGVYLASVIASFVVEGVYSYCLVIGAENTILRVRHALFRQVLSLNQRFFERQPTGQLMSRATSDVEALNEAISAGSVSLVLDVLSMVSVLTAMFWLDWRLAALLCLVGPPVAVVIEFARRRMRLLFAEIRDSLAALNAYAAERISGIEVIQLYGLESRVATRFGALNRRFRDSNVTNNLYDAGLYAFIDGIASICLALILWYSVSLDGRVVTIGLVLAFMDYIERLFRPLREFSAKVTFLQRASTALDKIFWLLGQTERITPGSRDLPSPQGSLRIRDLRFRYRDDAPWILDGISLDVKPGEVVAVVGRTGAGKSTLVRLLARVHDGYEGSIAVDGVELRELRPQAVRRAVGSVRQEVQLFRDTLRFNITLGDPTLDPERITAAIRESGADLIAARYPEGLDHRLRDRGVDLSAGEGQIISLARTLARDPSLVILDEATANVDPVSERLLQTAIAHIFTDRTCLVIAHRLSTITRADRIVVLAEGRVAECGSHVELLALDGVYASLYREGLAESAAGQGAP